MDDDDVLALGGPTTGTAQMITDAAGEDFAERGYVATSLRAVARRAHVDPRLVLYYFHDKHELLLQVLHQATLQLAAGAEPSSALTGAQLVAQARGSWRRQERIWRLVVACSLDGAQLPEPVLPALLRDALGASAGPPAAVPALRLAVAVQPGDPCGPAPGHSRPGIPEPVLAAHVLGLWLLTEGLPVKTRVRILPTLEARWADGMSLLRAADVPAWQS